MGLFKEEVHVIEEISRRQGRLYEDAYDYGIRLSNSEKSNLRRAVQSLRKSVPSRLTKTKTNFSTESHTQIFVPWEQDEGMVIGSKYTIHYWKDSKNEHFEITSDRFALPYDEFDSMHSTEDN